MTIGTGRAFERTGINKIMASFLKENGNAVVTEQIKLQQLGQISKGRGGEIRVKVKSRAALRVSGLRHSRRSFLP
ncbi:hypothetical protein Plhal703r1_c21g0093331 [Plasmopara halstedii]